MKLMKPYEFEVTFSDGVVVPVVGYASTEEIAKRKAPQWARAKRQRDVVRSYVIEMKR